MKEEGEWHCIDCIVVKKDEDIQTRSKVSFAFFSCYFCFFLKDDIKFIILCCSSDFIKYYVNNDLFKLPTYNFTIKCSMKICLVVTNHLFRIQTNYLTFDIQHHKLCRHQNMLLRLAPRTEDSAAETPIAAAEKSWWIGTGVARPGSWFPSGRRSRRR